MRFEPPGDKTWLARNGGALSQSALLVGLGLAALLAFFQSAPTANRWPAQDMFPFFIVRAGEAQLAMDFFTQCSLRANPRHVFGELVLALSALIGVHWYTVLSWLYALIAILTPPVMFLALRALLALFVGGGRAGLTAQIVAALAIAASLIEPKLGLFFTIAWWTPAIAQATPHALAQVLAASALVLSLAPGRTSWFGVVLLAAATLVHPTIGLGFGCVAALALAAAGRWTDGARVLGAALAGAASIALLFGGDGELPARAFVDIYALGAHPWHYAPSKFETLFALEILRPLGWTAALAGALVLIATAGGAAAVARAPRLALFCAGMALFLVGAVALQWFAVEVIPIKAVAALGPSRFLLWSFWFACLAVAILAACAVSGFKLSGAPQAPSGLSAPWRAGVIAVLAGAVMFAGASLRDRVANGAEPQDAALMRWIAQTPADAVFIAPPQGGVAVQIPIVAHRAVYLGNGFPFSDACFEDYDRRRRLVFGERAEIEATEGAWVGARQQTLYDSRDLAFFRRAAAAFPAHYVIVRREAAARFAAQAPELQPEFQDARYAVFALGAP